MTQTFRQGYAVIVGVGADLPVTIDDATAIANLLRDSSRCAYPTEQVRLLTGEEANATNILSALSWLADVTGKDDTVNRLLFRSRNGNTRLLFNALRIQSGKFAGYSDSWVKIHPTFASHSSTKITGNP